MSDKPKPGGYIDRAALAQALQEHRALVSVIEALIRDPDASRYRRAHLLQRAALHLARQRDSLAEMQSIRAKAGQRRQGTQP